MQDENSAVACPDGVRFTLARGLQVDPTHPYQWYKVSVTSATSFPPPLPKPVPPNGFAAVEHVVLPLDPINVSDPAFPPSIRQYSATVRMRYLSPLPAGSYVRLWLDGFIGGATHPLQIDPSCSSALPAQPKSSCLGKPATIVGTNGPDTLKGTPGPDVIVGLGSDDTMIGGGGDDVLCGGRGNDVLAGGGGNDGLDGGRGNDVVSAGAGNNLLLGGAGDDNLTGGSGDDIVKGEGGSDFLLGGLGENPLDGGPGSDTCQEGFDFLTCEA